MNKDVRTKQAQIEAKKAYLQAVETGDPAKIEQAEKNVYCFGRYRKSDGYGLGIGLHLHFLTNREKYQNG